MTNSNRKKGRGLQERLLWHISKLERGRFWYLASRMDVRILNSLNVFLHSIASMVILGVAAHLTSWSLIFPSLGPTIFLLFYAPSSAMAAPRSAITAHLAGALTGWACFHILLFIHPAAAEMSQTALPRIVTAALALGICGIFMTISGIVHPPAASTTLIAGLGMISSIDNIICMSIAVMLLCMLAWVMHRLAGIRYPLWAPNQKGDGPQIDTRLGRLSSPGKPERGNVQDIAARLASRQKLK